jgi:hypothetical protein
MKPSDPIKPIAPIPDDGSAPGANQRQLVLVKHGVRHVFRYSIGEEAAFLKGIEAMARSPESGITWFDAAVLSHQMGQKLSQDLKDLKRA